MKRNHLYFTLATCLFLTQLTDAQAESITNWDLPLKVSDQNTTVNFEVDTTWHVVYGKISNATGTVSLSDPNDSLSVVSEFHFPVASFETGWSARDDSLHDHMKAEKYPEVVFKTAAVNGDCTPQKVSEGSCRIKLVGTLTVCDVTKDVSVNATIEKIASGFVVNGEYEFEWAEYNVDDPSMIVAKVKPTVKVKYSVKLPEKVSGK